MPLVEANGLTIEVEQHGDASHPAVLLVMGLATQLVHWPPEFIETLVSAGYRVITFDNRDIGLSEKLESKSAPSPALSMLTGAAGFGWLLAPYDLTDMAADTAGVLDALDIDRAHVVGVSMGGMISQVLAGNYHKRVASLTTIMSSTNARSLPRADPAVVKEIVATRSRNLENDELVDRMVGLWQMIGTPEGGRSPDHIRDLVARSIARCNYPAGVRRQIAAIVASGSLRRWARQIKAPTLVVHGKEDRLTPYQGSVDIAATIPGARLDIVEGMGHDLPPKYMRRITRTIVEHMNSAENGKASTRAA